MKRNSEPLITRLAMDEIPNQHRSRGKLLAAGLVIFNEAGINAASIHDICESAGVSIGSAYHHFGSKQGLADALLVDGLSSNSEQLAARLTQVDGAEAGVQTLITSLIDWIETHPQWARYIYTVAESAERESAQAAISEVNTGYGNNIVAYFRPFVETGEMRKLPLEVYASLILGPVHDFARRMLAGNTKKNLSQYSSLFSEAAWRAVRQVG